MKKLFAALVTLIGLSTFTPLLQAAPTTKPGHTLGTIKTYDITDCSWLETCEVDGIEVSWDFDDMHVTPCQDPKFGTSNNLIIIVSVTNKNKYKTEIGISNFEVYAHKSKTRINGDGSFNGVFTLNPGDTSVFGYDELCFHGETEKSTVTASPTLASTSLRIAK